MRILVTDAAGFLGFHLVRRLASEGHDVHAAIMRGAHARDPEAEWRYPHLPNVPKYELEPEAVPSSVIREISPEVVVDLRAAATDFDPQDPATAAEYSDQLGAFPWMLQAARDAGVAHYVFASGAAVYGESDKLPFGTEQLVDRPLSPEGAIQRARELFASAFSRAQGLPCTALRFFTVYGPWGRPCQSVLYFARAALTDTPVALYDGGAMRRDFVYVDDAVEVLSRAIERPPEPYGDGHRYAVYNVGTGTPTPMSALVELIEKMLGRKLPRAESPRPATELPHTWADVRELQQAFGFRPSTKLADGIARTLEWLRTEEAAPWLES